MPQLPPTARAAARSAAATAVATRPTVARGPSRAAFSSSSPRLPADIVEQKLKVKRIIYTIGFAAVIITGTIYGAGLKTQQEWKASKQKLQEATVDEKVAMLEAQKLDLLRQKEEIEGKLAELRARMRSGAGDGEGNQARR
ncbi:hypothetical protein VTG60DRAFT_496 [Thermothelomyces hinnuleus]